MTALVLGVLIGGAVIALSARAPVHRIPGLPRTGRRRVTVADVVAGAERLGERARPARRWARRDAQLPDALERLGSAIRGGRALGPAVIEVARGLPDPLGSELREVSAALSHGAGVTTALAAWAARLGASSEVRLVAAALTLGAEGGGEVARAVDRVASTLRERRELAGEVRALATQARASAVVLAVAPLIFAALVATIEPSAIAFLVATPAGLGCLGLGLGLEALGARWMVSITASVR